MEDVSIAALSAGIAAAEDRLRGRVVETPLVHSPVLSRRTGANVLLKLEHLQHTGSFKVRGALNRLLAAPAGEGRRPVIAASSGNHGLAVAHALAVVGRQGRLVLPRGAAPEKVAALRAAGIPLRFAGDDCVEAERAAREEARAGGGVYLSPYDDPLVVAGQGTLGAELARQAAPHGALAAAFIAVGGGGLAAGVGAALRSLAEPPLIVGCQPRNSAAMAHSVAAGRIVAAPQQPTLSDATAGGIDEGAVTFPWCRALVDSFVLVDEDAIARAMEDVLASDGHAVEGAAGVALAGLFATRERFAGRTVAVVLCGRRR